MSSQGLERRFLCGRQVQGHVIGARFLVLTAWRLSSAVSRNQRREACVQPCAPDDPLAFASLRQAVGCAMRLMIALRQIVPTAAAAVCLLGASSALPQYPNNVPWPSWVSWAALGAAFGAYLLWFHLALWAIGRASKFQRAYVRLLVYAAVFLAVLAVPLAPLLPAYSMFGVCHIGLDCGVNMQGAFNVLLVAALHLPMSGAIPVCTAFIFLAVLLSRRAYFRESAA